MANVRRHSLSKEDRFSVDFNKAYANIKPGILDDKTSLDKALTAVLVLSILLSIAMVAYVIAVPKQGEKFTEFYILGADGKADNYPVSYNLSESKPVIVGIANHEQRNVRYDLIISLNDSVLDDTIYRENMTIADSQMWEKPINVTLGRNGTNMVLEFLLYADGNMTAPYHECHLWVNVTGNATAS
jgi:uncharacterized membrane protein